MLASFRRAKGIEGRTELLGYEQIDVLTIVPDAIAAKTEEYGEWCKNPLHLMAICIVHSDGVKSMLPIVFEDLMLDQKNGFQVVV